MSSKRTFSVYFIYKTFVFHFEYGGIYVDKTKLARPSDNVSCVIFILWQLIFINITTEMHSEIYNKCLPCDNSFISSGSLYKETQELRVKSLINK